MAPKLGAALVALGFLAAPSAYWLGSSVLYAAIGTGIAGLAILLWSRHQAGTAAAIGTGGPDAPGAPDTD